MAFLFPAAELVLDAVEAGAVSSFGNAVINTFAPPIKQTIADESGKIIGKVAKENPGGLVDKTVDASYFYKKRPHHHKKHHKRRVG